MAEGLPENYFLPLLSPTPGYLACTLAKSLSPLVAGGTEAAALWGRALLGRQNRLSFYGFLEVDR